MWIKYREIGRVALAAGVLAGLASQPLSAATEELTVYGGTTAAELRELEREFDCAMEAYVRSVGAQFRAALALDLRRSLAPDMELAQRSRPKPRLM